MTEIGSFTNVAEWVASHDDLTMLRIGERGNPRKGIWLTPAEALRLVAFIQATVEQQPQHPPTDLPSYEDTQAELTRLRAKFKEAK